MIGLRRMAKDDAAEVARQTRAGRLAQAVEKDYKRAIKRLDEAAD